MVQLLFALLSSDLDLDATVLKPYTIRVDWLYRWPPENLSGRDVTLTSVTLRTVPVGAIGSPPLTTERTAISRLTRSPSGKKSPSCRNNDIQDVRTTDPRQSELVVHPIHPRLANPHNQSASVSPWSSRAISLFKLREQGVAQLARIQDCTRNNRAPHREQDRSVWMSRLIGGAPQRVVGCCGWRHSPLAVSPLNVEVT